MTTSPPYGLFVGIASAARSFTAHWRGASRASAPREWPQTVAGFTALQAQLAETGVPARQTLVVLEATSSDGVRVAVTLHAAGYHVSVVNPKQIHHFSQSLPQRAKTDPLDAQVLSRFAAERQPPTGSPPPRLYHELHQRRGARDGLLEMRQQARNQLHALAQQPLAVLSVHQSLHALVDELEERIAALEEEITRLLRDGAWAPSATLLLTIPGISWLTAAWLLVTTLTFTLCPSAEAAAA